MKYLKILKGAKLFDKELNKNYLADNDYLVEDFTEHCGHARFAMFGKIMALDYEVNKDMFELSKEKRKQPKKND